MGPPDSRLPFPSWHLQHSHPRRLPQTLPSPSQSPIDHSAFARHKMSRRAPNPAAERAAQNLATLKSLLKLEPNKVCADCKRNKRTYTTRAPRLPD